MSASESQEIRSRIVRVRQTPPLPTLEDPEGTIRARIRASRLTERVRPGGSVAVGVGSRGIRGIAGMARAAVDALKELGYRPFVVAAMGSHGGATAEGQRELLRDYGVTPETMGVEVRTDMETVRIGESHVGLPIYFDRNAFQADSVVLINRVKPHTDFRGQYESGILKMLVIGLGKIDGASQIHKLGLRGLNEVMPAVGARLLRETPFALGLAIIENAADHPADIIALEPEEVLDREPKLLEQARGLMGRLPFDQLDVLIVGELGKNYSGAGMDPNVIGRLMMETQADFESPKITRLGVLDASLESHGNIVGVGFADLTTRRLVDRMDPIPFRTNVLTACFLERARIPIALPCDRDVFRVALDTCWRIEPEQGRLAIIPNTLELSTFWVSTALLDEIRAHPHLTQETDPQPIPFDQDGVLRQEELFPDSVRALRFAKSVG